jgi:hypothetical protein
LLPQVALSSTVHSPGLELVAPWGLKVSTQPALLGASWQTWGNGPPVSWHVSPLGHSVLVVQSCVSPAMHAVRHVATPPASRAPLALFAMKQQTSPASQLAALEHDRPPPYEQLPGAVQASICVGAPGMFAGVQHISVAASQVVVPHATVPGATCASPRLENAGPSPGGPAGLGPPATLTTPT